MKESQKIRIIWKRSAKTFPMAMVTIPKAIMSFPKAMIGLISCFLLFRNFPFRNFSFDAHATSTEPVTDRGSLVYGGLLC